MEQTQTRVILDGKRHATQRDAETLEQTRANRLLDVKRHAPLITAVANKVSQRRGV